jgi:hypothetical protein
MNRTALMLNFTVDPNDFHCDSYTSSMPEAPFPYRPRRGAPSNIVWPPKGLRLDVKFKAPLGAPEYAHKVTVTLHYEMYDGIPLMSKWLSITADPSVYGLCKAGAISVEYLAVNNQWGNATWGTSEVTDINLHRGSHWMYVETDASHGTTVGWGVDPDHTKMPGSFEPVVNVTYQYVPYIPLLQEGFESFRVHEIAVGSSDLERIGLSRHRMLRLLAPHTQENPIFFHMTNSSTEAVRGVVDQLAEVSLIISVC